MMNLQDLATVRTHNLPIKILVFENDGYSMIKGTYSNVGKPRKGVDSKSGLTLPDFCEIAKGFAIETEDLKTWADFDELIPQMLEHKGPFILQVHIDPEQLFLPRLKPILKEGKFTPARFDQLSPILETNETKELTEADVA